MLHVEEKNESERCGSNVTIGSKVRGGAREDRSDLSWIAHRPGRSVSTSPSSPVHLTLTRHREHSVLLPDSFQRDCVGSTSSCVWYRKLHSSYILCTCHKPASFPLLVFALLMTPSRFFLLLFVVLEFLLLKRAVFLLALRADRYNDPPCSAGCACTGR